MVCTKLFSLRQKFSHFIRTIEDKNFYVSITYPQYYWKVSIALRGCLEKFLTVLLIQLETFTVILRIFRKRKNAPHLYRTFEDGFYKVFKKNIEIIKCKRHRKSMPFALVIFNNRGYIFMPNSRFLVLSF